MKTSRRKFIKMSGAAAVLVLPGINTSIRAWPFIKQTQDVRGAGSLTDLLEYIFTEARQLLDINSQALALTELAGLYGPVSQPRAIHISRRCL